MTKHLSVADIRQRKDSPDKLVMSTAYDATFASLLSGQALTFFWSVTLSGW